MVRSLRLLPLIVALLSGGATAQEAGAGGTQDPNPSGISVDADGEVAGPGIGWGKAQGVLGILVFLGIAAACSENRRAISARTVLPGLGLQVALGLLLILVPAGRRAMQAASAFVVLILDCAVTGAEFVFGPQLVDPGGPAGFVFAFRVLPTVIFVAALFAVLYQVGVMQVVVRGFARVMARLLGSSGAESLNVAASLFLGQTEAPLTIRPFLAGLTRSELMVVMVSGMALVSGGVLGAYIEAGAEPGALLTAILMNAPASIVLAKIVVPETDRPETLGRVDADASPKDANVIDAAARGTREGLQLALNIAAILITFIALITLVDAGLLALGDALADWSGGRLPTEGLSLGAILGVLLAPAAWLIGVPWSDCVEVGGLLGSRLVLNELVAYGQLGEAASQLLPRSGTIATFALCGFANLSSIGIQVGGIGALVPERRPDLSRLGLRALLAATLANFLTASITGILLS
ncbi:NupC/NupG family nucleoside CNT transporter [Tautonia plasticadhaerens]|uniref:Nucleoside permease NupX n=1 Tax=Tautonia plasticadhaerens TaxID=2527974 RepID=A0A518H8V1_9BACT|nr:nucleoside transporter C-terminal domain-containing protein [Tautonia plasticadhaerens]QDV37264.1 Nucleoside permease NupX [Tautonia plasticadhaerens]